MVPDQIPFYTGVGGAPGGRFKKAVAEGIGHDRAVVGGVQQVVDAGKKLPGTGAPAQAQVGAERSVVDKVAAGTFTARPRAVEIIGEIVAHPFQFQAGIDIFAGVITQLAEEVVRRLSGHFIVFQLRVVQHVVDEAKMAVGISEMGF